ncbi:hypothetical protein Tco_0746319 [Tanacetum coccineum]
MQSLEDAIADDVGKKTNKEPANEGERNVLHIEDVGAEADLNNLETTMNVSLIPTIKIHKDHPKEQIIGDPLSAPQTRRMTKSAQEHDMVSYIKSPRPENDSFEMPGFKYGVFYPHMREDKANNGMKKKREKDPYNIS